MAEKDKLIQRENEDNFILEEDEEANMTIKVYQFSDVYIVAAKDEEALDFYKKSRHQKGKIINVYSKGKELKRLIFKVGKKGITLWNRIGHGTAMKYPKIIAKTKDIVDFNKV